MFQEHESRTQEKPEKADRVDFQPDKSPARIASMFDAISPRYDFLNHLLSAGLDRRWRVRAINSLELTGEEKVLDLCTGTADLAMAAVSGSSGKARCVVGIDFSEKMLELGNEKLRQAQLTQVVKLVRGDATKIPLAAASVDVAMIAFGIRNVSDPVEVCQEIFRVLRPGGKLVILEFGIPRFRVFKLTYFFFLFKVLPVIGQIISRHRNAYAYLPDSIATFLSRSALTDLLVGTGFSSIREDSLTYGIVSLYVASRE